MDQIISLHSPSHARALARVRTSAFSTGPLLRSMLPIEDNPRLVEDWLCARETLSLRDDRQSTFALVRRVGVEEEEEDEEVVSMEVCVEDRDVRYGDYHGEVEVEGLVGKRFVVLAFADWIRLPGGNVGDQEQCEGGGGGGGGGAETSLSPEAVHQKKELMFSADYLPEGTNLVLNAAFRKALVEGRKKYVDEERDCVLDILCTNPRYERQGNGKRLLEHGLKLIDAANKRVYVESTPVAVPLYERLGWKVLEVLEWKLADYGVVGEGDGDGKLRLSLMRREVGGV